MARRVLSGTLLFLFFHHNFGTAQNAVPGEYIVQLKSGAAITQTSMDNLLSGTVKRVISQDLKMVLVQRPAVETSDYSIQTLTADDAVRLVEPNFIYKISESSSDLPNDTLFTSQWSLMNTGQPTTGESGNVTGKAGVDIGARAGWMIETSARDILVGVIDTGVNYHNLDLIRALDVNILEQNGQPNMDDDANGCTDDVYGCDLFNMDGDPLDDEGHGTHVAGIIGARGNNLTGISGVVWSARILSIKAFDKDGISNAAALIAAMEYARKREVKIINASWGSPNYGDALKQAFKMAQDSGILVIAAAGNSGSDLEEIPEYPASYDFDNIVTVASVDPSGTFSKFSNYGKVTVDIAAPGANILSYVLNGMESKNGTSQAAPHVAGVAALLWAQDDSQDYNTIRSRLLAGIQPMGFLISRTASGGMLNAGFALSNTVGKADLSEPYYWLHQSQPLSSGHPYSNGTDKTWTFQVQGATQIAVHFTSFGTEEKFDFVEIIDGFGKTIATLTGVRGECYSPVIQGDTVTIRFKSDGSVAREGWDIDHIAYQ